MPININPPEKEFALNLEAQFAESLRLIVINCQEKCRPQASDILKQNTIVVNRIDPPEFWAEGDYWIKDGKHYRLAGFRCVDKETGKEVGKSGII